VKVHDERTPMFIHDQCYDTPALLKEHVDLAASTTWHLTQPSTSMLGEALRFGFVVLAAHVGL
jgi:hypothetical protein